MLLVFPNTKIDKAKSIAERVRKLIFNKKHLVEKGERISVSVSIGVYEVELEDEDFVSCVKKADVALYQAKSISRNCVVSYSEI